MNDNTRLAQDRQQINELEAEYRTWRVAVIRLGRDIDDIERQLWEMSRADPGRAAGFMSRLSAIREQHDRLEAKLDRIRARLDEAYACLGRASALSSG